MTLYDFFLKLTRPVGFLVFFTYSMNKKNIKKWNKMKKKFSAPIFFFFSFTGKMRCDAELGFEKAEKLNSSCTFQMNKEHHVTSDRKNSFYS
jgi:hypothetical protein